ncbi:hypothetical protein [Streptomyces sp. SP18CS02]|uniref:hypothetical protein n=1 Tax=Streptomyces sp. SP18CS02 TaxID=3002531 RepID=UPI002E78D53F|nr:hypothetical protein [Streptomyces sp. SP18CS02]MEE1751421.1 hypothetical protein [Streptomyces sp. SP18CS02]
MEAEGLGPDAVAIALARYHRYLDPPGPWRPPRYDEDWGYPDDHSEHCVCPVCARETLQGALEGLPGRGREDLERLVLRLDERFRRRTVPLPPDRLSPWAAEAWWRGRVMEDWWRT